MEKVKLKTCAKFVIPYKILKYRPSIRLTIVNNSGNPAFACGAQVTKPFHSARVCRFQATYAKAASTLRWRNLKTQLYFCGFAIVWRTVHTNPSRKRSFISTVRPTVHTNPSRKRSFISTVRPTVHTNPSRKRSFISTVRPTVHTNPSRKRSFSKTLFKPEKLKTQEFCFRIDGKQLEKEL